MKDFDENFLEEFIRNSEFKRVTRENSGSIRQIFKFSQTLKKHNGSNLENVAMLSAQIPADDDCGSMQKYARIALHKWLHKPEFTAATIPELLSKYVTPQILT